MITSRTGQKPPEPGHGHRRQRLPDERNAYQESVLLERIAYWSKLMLDRVGSLTVTAPLAGPLPAVLTARQTSTGGAATNAATRRPGIVTPDTLA